MEHETFTRGPYKVQLRYQVIQKLREGMGFHRVRHMARELGRDVSTVWNHLDNLRRQGLAVKVRGMYVWRSHLTSRGVAASYWKKLASTTDLSTYELRREVLGRKSNNSQQSPYVRSSIGGGPSGMASYAAVG